MKYEQEPRPDIENHYHIRSLIEFQEKKSNDRTYHREREKDKADREDTIRSAQNYVLTDFYCDKCELDFKAQANKEVELDWNNTMQNVAFYRTKCFKNHWCVRFITDKHKDPYWYKSKAVARDRFRHYADTIQPHETGFNMLYNKI